MASDTLTAFHVLLRHYRQAPMQLVSALVGIVLAVSLLIGVKAINERAKDSYQNASELLAAPATHVIGPQNDYGGISDQQYVALKQAGIENIAPYISGWLTLANGDTIKLTGLDILANWRGEAPLTLETDARLDLAELWQPPFVGIVSRDTANRLGLEEGDSLALSNQRQLPILISPDERLGSGVMVDIAAAKWLLQMPQQLSYIAIFSEETAQQVEPLLIDGVRMQAQDKGLELASLTDSFHLNLQAISYLAFIVGAFIGYHALRFSLLQRQHLLLRLRQLGLDGRAVAYALALEMILISAIGAALGVFVGLQLAQWLQPMVAMTLEQLYQVTLLPGQWRISWFIQAWLLTLATAALALAPTWRQLHQTKLTELAELSDRLDRNQNLRKRLFGLGVLLTLSAFVTLLISQHPRVSLGATGALTLAIPLMLPLALERLLLLVTKPLSKRPAGLGQWLLSDARQLADGLSLALMAMVLALCANLAINTLVSSFEVSLKGFLNQRLAADIYLRPPAAQREAMEASLKQRGNDVRVVHYYQTSIRLGEQPVLVSSSETDQLANVLAMKDELPLYWPEFGESRRALISEPLALRMGLEVGQTITLAELGQFQVAAIYYDYGNPRGQAFIPMPVYQQLLPQAKPLSLGLFLADDQDPQTWLTELTQSFNLSEQNIIDQQKLRQTALAMFEQTFAITLALNSLTLLVASIGLFSALLSLSQQRQAVFALLTSLGLSPRQVLGLAVAQNLTLVLASGLLALPFSAMLAWALIDKVTLHSFGWTIAMSWQWSDYFYVLAIALIATGVASLSAIRWQLAQPLLKRLQTEAR
ncbi:ABC transporter permease [Paraferrimonas sedimenticola]|uniref:ABC transport system permease protein n=1 Tax=Paraferrimonas sedimenticola TaxID=375674 RepID=A0AA37VU92_9GAMM|nr:FtsX-like permease family protein [Paraferrimonas sedimenticola]GLP95531.1 hypothetical protein GCM10007895_08370 [Paraferrimonas sedimenticola]